MNSFLFTLLMIALGSVVVVLGLGLFSMARGGEFARKHSNTFMRWRIYLQALAVLLFLIILFFYKR